MRSSFLNKYDQHPTIFYYFLVILTLINLLQAGFTELFHDEAYYWMWSKELAWGYYDHPPMIAWLIRLGNALVNNELGVRLLTVILHSISLFLLYQITDKKHTLLFIFILFSIPFVHIAGILAVPDSPFMFFTALYLYAYYQFLEKDDWSSTFLLSFAITGMLYSKYHSLMVLFFTILSFPKLLTNKKFWVIVAICSVLYLPFLSWSYQHGFDTLKYHLGGRTRSGYKIEFTLNYLIGEVLAAGALVGVWYFFEAFSLKTQTQFQKSLKWICVGIFGFLFIRTFSQHVEANWAASAFLPLILLAYQGISQKENRFKLFYGLAIPVLAILLIGRMFLVVNFLPESVYKVRNEFHNWDKWAEDLTDFSKGKPIVFSNSYQYPSKYLYYANYQQDSLTHLAMPLNSAHYRHNQYDIADYEEKIQGNDVLWLSTYPFSDTLKSFTAITGDKYYYLFVHNFHSFNKVKIKFELPKTIFKPNELVKIPITLTNGYPYPCDFSACKELPTIVGTSFWQKEVHKWQYSQIFPETLANTILKDTLQRSITAKMPAEAGDYDMTILLDLAEVQTGYNASIVKIKVEN